MYGVTRTPNTLPSPTADADEPKPTPETAKAPRSLDQSVTTTPKPAPTIKEKPAPPIMDKNEPEAVETAPREPVTGSSRMDHAPNFAWIVGRMEFLHMKNQWRIRYAGFDSDDKYGGVVTLGGVDHLSAQFKDGMTVRLQGQMVEPDGKKGTPEYFVHAIKVIK